jgi:hypothetical protein
MREEEIYGARSMLRTKGNEYKIVEKKNPGEKKSLRRRYRHRYEDIVKVSLKIIGVQSAG